MEQNKIRSYLFYGLGDVSLVVVGILLALYISNWNEDRKGKAFQTEILMLIDQNLSRDSTSLSAQLRSAELGNQSTDSILNQVSMGIYDERLNTWMGSVISFERFKSQSSAYEVLKSKGIDNISDNELQIGLISYYDESLFNVYESLNDVSSSFREDWIPVVKKEFSDFSYKDRLVPTDAKQFFENPSTILLFKLYKDNRKGSILGITIALSEISMLKEMIKNQ